MLRALYRSASLRAAAALALGGAAFALGNLLLAKVLPSREYGLVSLVIGIVAVSGLTAPLGFDLVVGRRGFPLDATWRRAVIAASMATALATAALSSIIYHLDLALLICVLIMTIAAGMIQASAAHFQGQRHFGMGVWILQFSNWALVPVALMTMLIGYETALESCFLMAVFGLLAAVTGWLLVTRHEKLLAGHPGEPPPKPGALFTESLSLMTITTSSSVFLQLERLLVAPTVGVHDLAMYGVLAVLAGSPFRMLQAAVQFTLVPALRETDKDAERQRLLRREILLVMIAMAGSSAAIWWIAPPIAHWFLGGRYDLSATLMAAVLVSGILKVFCAFAVAIVVALAQEKGLRVLSAVSWSSIGLSVLAAFVGAQWGLVGVLYGISAGWLVRSLLTTWMAVSHLRPASLPAVFINKAG